MASLVVTWHGFSCLKIVAKNEDEEAVLLCDPFAPEGGLKMPRGIAADVVLASHAGVDRESVSGTPFVIAGPGEYEIKKVFVYGIASGAGTVYRIEVGDLSFGFLGAASAPPAEAVLQQMEGVDVLALPTGGQGKTLTSKQAVDIVTELEPRIVLPIYTAVSGLSSKLDPAAAFFREMGASGEQVDKVKVQRKDLPQEQTLFYELTLP